MQDLKDRYERLSVYVQTSSLMKLNKLYEKLTEENMKTFEEKLVKAEEMQAKLEPWIAQLKEKKDQFDSIEFHDSFSDMFKRSYEAQKKKLADYEWDNESGKLIKGTPTEAKVKAINMQTLMELYGKQQKPVAQLIDRAKFETLKIRCENDLAKIMPLIQKAPDGTETLEKLNTLLAEAQASEEDQIDVTAILSLSNKLLALNKNKCSCGKDPVHKDKCHKCWKEHWTGVYKDIKKRERAYEKSAGPAAYAEYEAELSDPFQEVYHLIESKGDKTSYGKIQKIYKKMDAKLPSLDSLKDSQILTYAPDREGGLSSSYEEDSFIESDSESESESDSEYEKKSSGKKRERVEIGDVLEILAPQSELAQQLYDAYNDDEEEDFASAFKRIKESAVDTFKVSIFTDGKPVPIPLPEPFMFFSESDANERAKELAQLYNLDIRAYMVDKPSV